MYRLQGLVPSVSRQFVHVPIREAGVTSGVAKGDSDTDSVEPEVYESVYPDDYNSDDLRENTAVDPEDQFVLNGGRLGPMLTNIDKNWPARKRIRLAKLAQIINGRCGTYSRNPMPLKRKFARLSAEQKEWSDVIGKVLSDYHELIVDTMASSNTALREVLKSASTRRPVKLYSVVKRAASVKDYSGYISRFLHLFTHLAMDAKTRRKLRRGPKRDRLPVMRDSMVGAFTTFADDVDWVEDADNVEALHTLLVSVVGFDGGLASSYVDYLPCLFAITDLTDADTGAFVNVQRTCKAMSALKYFLRGTLLIEASREIKDKTARNITVIEIDSLVSLAGKLEGNFDGKTNTLTTLARMSKVASTFVPPKTMITVFPTPSDHSECLINGKPCGTDVLSQMVETAKSEAEAMIAPLMLGYPYEELHDDDDEYADHVDEEDEGFSFGRDRDVYHQKLYHFVKHGEGDSALRKRFWTVDKKKLVVNADGVSAYLRDCLELEKRIGIMFHVLSGCGTRGTDYELQTFRNSARHPRNVTVLDTALGDRAMQFAVPIAKTTLLHNKPKNALRYIKMDDVKFVLPYYLIVRPFAAKMRRQLGSGRKLGLSGAQVARLFPWERWNRFLYVNPGAKAHRKNVADAVKGATEEEKGAKFNEVRHAAIAIHRRFVTPREHKLLEDHPVHQGFGHSRNMDNNYGCGPSTQALGAIDGTSVLRCSRLWWDLLE
jgi:hypothetical protein